MFSGSSLFSNYYGCLHLQTKKKQHLSLQVKYKEDYEKFKSLYSLPKSLQDDPATARCVQVGKLVLDVRILNMFTFIEEHI